MLDLPKFIPKTIKIGKKNLDYKLHFTNNKIPECNKKITQNKIGIWYETKTPTNGRNIHYFILPQFVNENKELYESIGLYLAEGAMNFSNLVFSNDEPKVINIFMKTFKNNFQVSFSDWLWSICFNDKLKRNENKKTTENRERASINFWLKKTKIDPDSVSKTPCRYSNKNSKGKLKTKKKWGSLTIVFGNKILKNLWLEIIKSLVEKVLRERNKDNAASILRGWMAGDGYCRFEIYDKPRRELGITCRDREKIKIIYKLFEILGIEPIIYEGGVRLIRAEYLVKAYNYKLTSLHILKHKNLLKSLLSYIRIPEAVEKLKLEKIETEFQKIEKEIREREKLFESLKYKKLLNLGKEINWQFLINGLLIKEGLISKKLNKEIVNGKAFLIGKWLKGTKKPSRKYQLKLLERIKKYSKEELIEVGKFFLNGNWPNLFEGLQIFLKASRTELAKKLKIHPNTIESFINERKRPNRITVSKILNLIENYKKNPGDILRIYKRIKNISWPNYIKRILIKNEWSQRALAERLGCSRSLVREWIGGLEPVNKYKGKLLEFSEYQKKIRFNFREIIKRALKTYTLLDLGEKLGVSIETIRNWKKGSKIQPRHLKKIIEFTIS